MVIRGITRKFVAMAQTCKFCKFHDGREKFRALIMTDDSVTSAQSVKLVTNKRRSVLTLELCETVICEWWRPENCTGQRPGHYVATSDGQTVNLHPIIYQTLQYSKLVKQISTQITDSVFLS